MRNFLKTIFSKGRENGAPQPNSVSSVILVYQMGRVGSKSIEDALLHLYGQTSTKVFHLHYLANFEELESRASVDLADTSRFLADNTLKRNQLQELIASATEKKVKIVSLVRDPVARNASTFFYALDEFIPGWEYAYAKGDLSLADMIKIFVSKKSYVLTAFNWFDEQVKPVFDIDVYQTPFPQEIGYQIYSSSKADLLLLRLENLRSCAREAFAHFLGIPNLALQTINAGSERKTADLYRLFMEQPLPREYVDWTYSYRLAQHFYTKAELDKFKRNWVKVNP
jgi:hypothetical protein